MHSPPPSSPYQPYASPNIPAPPAAYQGHGYDGPRRGSTAFDSTLTSTPFGLGIAGAAPASSFRRASRPSTADAYTAPAPRRDSGAATLHDDVVPSYHAFPYAQPPAESNIRPHLRRSSTEHEQELEHDRLRHLAAREAIALVDSHTRRGSSGDAPPIVAHLGDRSGRREYDECGYYPDRLEEGLDDHTGVGSGVLSHLLRLYGNQSGLRRRSYSDGSWEGKEGGAGGVPQTREASFDLEKVAGGGRATGRARPALKRGESVYTDASSGEEDQWETKAEPTARGRKTRKNKDGKAVNLFEDEDFPEEKVSSSKAQKEAEERAVYEAMKGKFEPELIGKKGKIRKHALKITAHVADIIQRQAFILKLAKALMTFGAPSHRLESQLNATAKVLEVDAQFIHIPSVVIASFGDADTHTTETKFIKASGGLNLGALHDVHHIYRQVVHDEIGVEEGSVALTKLLQARPIYNLWQRMCIAACCAGIIAPLGFGGSFVDAFVSGAFGATLAFLQLYAARKNAIFSNIFEISIAALISFVARGLSTTNMFCYEALSSAGVVLVLPGYIILCGSLELASKNLVAGSVRMVYAIIYTLFLGFSIAVGSDLFFLFDPKARATNAATAVSTVTLTGTFSALNASESFMGAFSFTNQTSSAVNSAQASLQKGNIMCYRDPSWEWWRQSASIYWLILLVPAFSFFLSLWNLQPLRSRELPVMIVIAVIGFITNRLATEYIFDRSDIVSFIGASVIGLLGNMYSRVFKGTSFTAMATGVLFLVPSGIAAAGGLAMTNTADGNSYNSGLMIGFRMVQVAIGITIGLFFSSFLIYSIGTKKKGGGLGFAF